MSLCHRDDESLVLMFQLHVNLTPHQVYFLTLFQPKFYNDFIGKLQSDIKNTQQFLSWAGIQLQLIQVEKVRELVSTLIPSPTIPIGCVVTLMFFGLQHSDTVISHQILATSGILTAIFLLFCKAV